MDAAAAVVFDADTKYCTATDTYLEVANAWVNAAKARVTAGNGFPANATHQTYNAWKAAGITPTVLPNKFEMLKATIPKEIVAFLFVNSLFD